MDGDRDVGRGSNGLDDGEVAGLGASRADARNCGILPQQAEHCLDLLFGGHPVVHARGAVLRIG